MLRWKKSRVLDMSHVGENVCEVKYWDIFTVRNEVAKFMFLHMSVSHSVHRGRGVLSQHGLQVVSQHALQQRGAIPACIAGAISACLAAGGSAPGGVPAPGGSAPGGACSRWGLPPSRGDGYPPCFKADGYCCGRYASYWNAFLFYYVSSYGSLHIFFRKLP